MNLGCVVALCLAVGLPGVDPPSRVVAARVDGRAIYQDQVERQLRRALGERPVEPEAQPALEAQALEQLVRRELVLGYLERQRSGASDQDVQLALEQLQNQLAQADQTLADYLAQRQLDEPQLRRELAWQIGWPRFLERYLTDENLQRYFEQHRRDFDGTQVKVAHILLRIEPDQSLEQVRVRAEQLRQQIVDGELEFAAAAREHSQAPTAAEGGQLGWIDRYGAMPEPFSQAAFQLEPGQISPPVISPFGVHLIECLDVKPGTDQWQDVRDLLEQHVTRYLFTWAADQHRSRAKIEYTGTTAYLDPVSGQVVPRRTGEQPGIPKDAKPSPSG